MNELIADFMGFTHTNHGFEDKHGNIITEALDYHKDWNHLMDVVEKCYSTEIQLDFIIDIANALTDKFESNEERKQTVWKECLHLIQYVNKQK